MEIINSVSDCMFREKRCLEKLHDDSLKGKLSYEELLKLHLHEGVMKDEEYKLLLLCRYLGRYIIDNNLENDNYGNLFRHYLVLSLEVCKILNTMKKRLRASVNS